MGAGPLGFVIVLLALFLLGRLLHHNLLRLRELDGGVLRTGLKLVREGVSSQRLLRAARCAVAVQVDRQRVLLEVGPVQLVHGGLGLLRVRVRDCGVSLVRTALGLLDVTLHNVSALSEVLPQLLLLAGERNADDVHDVRHAASLGRSAGGAGRGPSSSGHERRRVRVLTRQRSSLVRVSTRAVVSSGTLLPLKESLLLLLLHEVRLRLLHERLLLRLLRHEHALLHFLLLGSVTLAALSCHVAEVLHQRLLLGLRLRLLLLERLHHELLLNPLLIGSKLRVRRLLSLLGMSLLVLVLVLMLVLHLHLLHLLHL
eukprot:Rhum_TRINITY_DN12191_c1_g1::Rhum_TRINITY_DN12191_c1_g1_i1::g.49272::m.49272